MIRPDSLTVRDRFGVPPLGGETLNWKTIARGENSPPKGGTPNRRILPLVFIVALLAASNSLEAGTVIGWGQNKAGQLNFGPATNALAIAAGGFQSMMIRDDNSLQVVGSPTNFIWLGPGNKSPSQFGKWLPTWAGVAAGWHAPGLWEQ
jgi:hypothetical protein